MRFLFRLIVLITLFLLVRSLLEPVIKTITAMFRPAAPPAPAPRASAPETRSAELKKDPVCGTFIAPELAITQKFNGQIVHFCSQKCRDAYVAAHKG
jgi:YHS domain-containing protein